MPEGRDDLVDGLLGPDDGDQVLPEELVLAGRARDGALLAAAQTGELQLPGDRLGDVADHGAVGALHPDGAVHEGGGGVLVAAAVAQGQQAEEEHADDAVEVGHRVAHGGDRGAVGDLPGERRRVARRRQGGGVGERAGVGARDHGAAHAKRVPDADARGRGQDEEREHEGERPDGRADDVEEVGAGLDADGEGEDRQAQRSQVRGNLHGDLLGDPDRRQGDAGEQHGGRAQAHALDPDVPDEHAQPDEQEQDENRVLGQVVEKTDEHG